MATQKRPTLLERFESLPDDASRTAAAARLVAAAERAGAQNNRTTASDRHTRS